MKTMGKKGVIVLGIAVLAMLPVLVFAQDDSALDTAVEADKREQKQEQLKTSSRYPVSKEELLRLKKNNPAEFDQQLKQRREKIRERLEYLKENNPERYEKLRKQIHKRRTVRLERLRKEDPAKFKEIMQQQRQRMQERLKRLKTEDPQRYERIMAHREQIQKLRRLKKEDPEKFREFLQERHQRKENLGDYRHSSGEKGHRHEDPWEEFYHGGEEDYSEQEGNIFGHSQDGWGGMQGTGAARGHNRH